MFTFSGFVDALLKARGHKYIKRIPYMSGGKRRYRYIYKVTHTHQGKQAFDAEHLDVGTAFALTTEAGAEFHGHITKVRGDQVTYRIDDGERKGELVTASKSELLSQLNDVHGIESKLSAERDKLRSQIEVAREKGSEKQVRRLEERLARLGGEEKRAEPEPKPKKKRATRKKSKRHGTALSDSARAELRSLTADYDRTLREIREVNPNLRYDEAHRRAIRDQYLSFSLSDEFAEFADKVDRLAENNNDPRKLYRGLPMVSWMLDELKESGDKGRREVLSRMSHSDENKLMLSMIADVQGRELTPLTPENKIEGAVYSLYSNPDLVSPNGIAIAYGSARMKQDTRGVKGIYLIDTKSGATRLIDNEVTPHQAPYVLRALASDDDVQNRLFSADVEDVTSMRDLVARLNGSMALSRGKADGDVGEFVARVLA